MGPNANGDIDYSWVGATAPPGVSVGDNWTARYLGQITPATPGLGYTLRIVVGPNDVGTLYVNDVAQTVATGNGSVDGTGSVTFTDANPWRIRIDFKAGVGSSKLRLGWTPAGGTETFALGTAVKPGFFYATRSTTDDSTGSSQVPATMVSETRFDEGIDPVYAIATSTTVDPAGAALKTVTGFETPGAGSLLRRTRRSLPAFAGAPSAANSTSYNYYGDADVVDNPCIAGVQNAPQAGLAKQTISAAPATGTAITTEVVYDIVGRPVASRYVPDSVWTCTVYDARGRVVQVTFPADGTYPAGRTVSTVYRAGGDPFRTTVADNTVTGSTNGSTITTVVDGLGRTVASTDVWGLTTTTGFDQAGRVTAMSAPNGVFGYFYDNIGRLTRETRDGADIATVTYTADSAALDPGVLKDVTYPAGAGNGTKGVIGRDSLGRVTSISWTRISTGAVITSDMVTRSLTGRVLTDTIDGATTPAWSYTYDGAGRLTNAAGSGHNYMRTTV